MKNMWQNITLTFLFAMACSFAAFAESQNTETTDAETLSVPAKLLSVVQDEPQVAMMVPSFVDEPEPEVTIVPPQYLTSRNLPDHAANDDSHVRLLVALPNRVLLLDADVQINEKPFRMARQLRVAELLKQLEDRISNPQPSEAEEQKAITENVSVEETSSDSEAPTASEESAESESEEPAEDADGEDRDEPPPVDNSLIARLQRYTAATKRMPTPQELNWLLEHWSSGPKLLLLNEGYENVRALQSPLFQILDRDDNGIISVEEVSQSSARVMGQDRNQDEVVSTDELTAAANKSERSVQSRNVRLIPIERLKSPRVFSKLLTNSSGNNSNSWLASLDENQDGQLSPEEFEQLESRDPDLSIQVNFNSDEPTLSRIVLSEINKDLKVADKICHSNAILLLVENMWLELSATQLINGPVKDQISVGIAEDGYPMLPEMNYINDGRLTIREIRKIPQTLATFDRNADGAISENEVFPTIRVAIGLGPNVHLLLANTREVIQPDVPQPPAPPEWFARMDKNSDRDLSIKEFLGTEEQFNQMDLDQDELISSQEAIDFQKKE